MGSFQKEYFAQEHAMTSRENKSGKQKGLTAKAAAKESSSLSVLGQMFFAQ